MKTQNLNEVKFSGAVKLSRNEMKKIFGGLEAHLEPCNSHSDCTSHAPICVVSGTGLGSVCCDVASLQPGGVCNFNRVGEATINP